MKFSEIWYVDASQQNKMLQKNFFWISAFFGRFLTKKQPKLTKYEENRQNPNRLMKFSEIWYVDAPQQKNATKNFFLDFGLFWSFFNQKTVKIVKNEENWQNPNSLMKFSEIWYVDASQQNKMLQKNYFSISAFFLPFLAKKQPKLTKNEDNWQNSNCLIKVF